MGASGCVVPLAVLGMIVLIHGTKKQALENLPKRVYLAIVLYTLLYSSMVRAAVNYSHHPSQESACCEALGFLLHYSTCVCVRVCTCVCSGADQLQALENLPKRVYLATVLYTLLNSSMVIAAWCEALGFLLHYTGTLMIVHYCDVLSHSL